MKLAVALCAAAFLVLEISLRIIGYAAPEWYQLDTRLGWSLKRHKHGWSFTEGERIAIYINSAGMRDREHSLDKPAGVFRIAVLGDDYSEAFQVPIQRAWWWQLAPLLRECKAAKDVEVLNFGVGGYGTTQELVMLQTTAMRYQPDLVLLQFSSRDDVADNAFALAQRKERPFFVLDRQGVARIDDSFIWSAAFDRHMQTRYRLGEEIADHSRVFQLARQLAGHAFIAEAQAVADPAALGPPRDARWEDAWRITEAVIGKIADYSRRNGAELAVVTVPHPLQAGQGIAYPDQRLQSLGRTANIPVIPLADALRGDGAYLRSGEWTVAGHSAAARAVAAQLCNSGTEP